MILVTPDILTFGKHEKSYVIYIKKKWEFEVKIIEGVKGGTKLTRTQIIKHLLSFLKNLKEV